MPQDDLEFRELVEYTADDQAHRVKPSLNLKTPDRAVEIDPRVQDVVRVRRQIARMDVDRRVERCGGLENRPVFRIVEIFAVSMGIDDEAIQF